MRLNGVGRCGPLLLTVSLLLLLFLTHSSSSFTHATASPYTPSTHLSSSYASIDWSTLNSTTLASLPLSVISVAASSDLSSLPASACSGWRTNQIRALQNEACQGFRPECIAVITNDVIGNMTDGCVHFVSAIGVSGLSAEQLSHVSLTAIASMDASALAGLKSDACAGFTRTSVHVLGNATSLFPSVGNACSGISSDCVDHMPEDGFAELTQSCTLYLQTSAISALSNAQVAHMASGPFRVMSVAQVGSLQSSTCGGLRADQVAALPDYGPIAPILAPRQCTALTTSCVTAMPVDTFGGFTRDCVADLNATSFSQISSAQLGALTLNATSGMSWADLAALGPCDGLSEQQIGVLGTYQPSNDACNGFRADCMAALNPTKFAAFQPTCFNLLPNSAFTLLTSSQIGSVTPGALQGLTAGQLKSLPAGSCSGLTAAQVSLLGSLNPYDTCAGFTAECLQALDATAFGALTSSCFNHIPSAFIAAFTLAQLRSISESILSGITTAQLIKWVDQYGLDLVADIWTSPDLVDEISDDALLGFKAAIGDNQIAPKYQLTDTSVRSLSSITSLQLAYCVTSCMNLLLAMNEGSPTTPNILFLPLHSYRGLRGDQIASIPSNIFAQIGISVYSQLLSDAVSAITPSQILSVDPAVFAALNIGDLSVESGTVSVLSQAQIETVSNHQWRTQWGCSQYNNFTLDQRRWMGEAEATFHRECSGGQFPTAQPCSDDTSKFSLLVFIVSVVSSGVGTLIFSIIIYMCCLRRKGIPLLYDTDHSGSDYLSNSSSTLPVTVSSASAHRRIRSPNAYGNSDYSLRSPLHPNSQPTNFGRIHQSPVKSMAASYTSNHINDQDDIGSRF